MSVSTSQQTATSAQTAKMPGEVVRGLVSLWLIIHFLGILLAICTQNELAQSPDGGEMSRSQLLTRLKQVPPLDQYIYALWFDVPYNYYLANSSTLDGGFSLRMDLVYADGKTETLNWPPNDAWFGERRERLARLAQLAARAGENNDSGMAALIGKAVLKLTGAKDMTFNVYRHQPLSLDDARSSDTALRDANHERTVVRAYTAKVRLNAGGEAEVSVPQEARDVAAPNQPATGSATPDRDGNEGGSQTAPSNPRRQRAEPLPQPERAKKKFTVPPSLFRPSDPATDPSTPSK
jgi:hypothetical protein